MNLKMTSDKPGETESDKAIPVGTEVEYIAHVTGGMVKVRLADGSVEIMHPACFAELR